MKKIICFLPYLVYGGAEKAALNLCNDLSKQYLVTIIMLNKKNFPKNHTNKNIKFIYLNKKRLLTSIFSLSYFLIKIKPHFFISFLYSTNVIATLSKLISLSSAKLIFSVQNNFSKKLENNKSFRTIISLNLFKIATLFSYKIITCSDGLKNEIKEIAINKKQVYFVYNPIIDKDFYSISFKFDIDLLKFNLISKYLFILDLKTKI